tara:strand:- start:306 stop:887 length:582 start_codon:yes stop_codon:yes gene_type:complete
MNSDSDSLSWQHLDSSYDENAQLLLFRKRIDRVRNPRNQREFDRLVLESPDWVNVVALDDLGRCIMVKQYRFGVRYNTLETPGGMVEKEENSLQAAKRELLEETGYSSDSWTYLGAVEPNPAFQSNLCHHWLAKDVQQLQKPDLDDGEAISIALMREEEVRSAVQTGEIKHALALSVLSRVFKLWPLPFENTP